MLHAIDSHKHLCIMQAVLPARDTANQRFMIRFLQRRGELQIERQGAFLVGFQLDDNHTIGQRGEDGALVLHTIICIMCSGNSITQIQVAVVAGNFLMTQLNLQAAQREETHAVGAFEEVLVNELMGFILLAFEDELAHLLQMGLCLRAVVIMRGA